MYSDSQVLKGLFSSKHLFGTLISLFIIAACYLEPTNARAHPKLNVPATSRFLRESRDSNKIDKANNKAEKQLRVPYLRMRSVPSNEFVLPVASSHTLECEAGGTPVPTIRWLKDGKPIEQGDTVKIENQVEEGVLSLSFTRSRLFLDCLSYKDSGVYSCVAENGFNRIASESQVSVSPDLSELEASDREDKVLCLPKKSYGLPARVYMWTHNRLEQIGSDAQLFCRFEGFPHPSVMWLGPENIPIINSEKFHVLENGDLAIKSLSWDDMGTYTCVVENKHGVDKASTFVYPTLPEK